MYKEKGLIEEAIFKLSVNLYSDFDCVKSHSDDDKFKHIDFYLSNGHSVDVKSSNRFYKGEYSLWFELTNIYGNRGWLYGKATYIAFSLGDKYIFFRRRDLVRFIFNRNINTKNWTFKVGFQNVKPYVVYRRQSFKDRIIMIPLKDLLKLNHFFVKRDISLLNKIT